MTSPDERPSIDIYPVGLLSDLKHHGVRRGVRRTARYVGYGVRLRNWRSVKNTFNGYLAEVSYGNLLHTRCGHGWTRKRAARRLGVYLARDNGGLTR